MKFFSWLEDEKPTWYSAVPTMHQGILMRSRRYEDLLHRTALRFVRSSSASLPPAVFEQLQATFRCPVIESYGMTEATHQMTSNPLPPLPQKPGTVGLPAGPEVAIMTSDGEPMANGEVGEVCVRGPNITPGYDNNPEANRTGFFDQWFRTGDQGFFDPDGYLTITGRIKEIINRGGEKVSPLEVDNVLMDHPSVAQVVTFALPHRTLGEDVAAAVVLVKDAELTESELRDYAASKLAAFKVPRTMVMVDEIPKGATGKLQRIGLAEKLGLVSPS